MLFIHSSIDAQLNYFYLLAVVNNATMGIFLKNMFPAFNSAYIILVIVNYYIANTSITRSCGNFMYNFLSNRQLFTVPI